jgi:hypothetical protein
MEDTASAQNSEVTRATQHTESKMQVNPADAFGKLQRDDTGAVTAWHPLISELTAS